MIISVIPHSEKKDLFEILIDEESWRSIHISIFGRRPSFPSQVNSLEEWNELFDQAEYRCVKNYVLRRLSMQSYHSVQLIKSLEDRLARSTTIERVIQECISWGYLNDQAWLDSFMRVHIKRHSMRAISFKLQSKGIARSCIQELMEAWHNPAEEEQALQHLLRTRYGKKDLNDYKEKQKVIGALVRKGYSFELIRSALNDRE